MRGRQLGIAGALLLVGLVALSGCVQQGQDQGLGSADQNQPNALPGEAKPSASVGFTGHPLTVLAGEEFLVTWNVYSYPPSTINHTAVHWSLSSVPGELGRDVTPEQVKYDHVTPDYASGAFSVPMEFSSKITAPPVPGTIYLRAHAISSGMNYWTDEMQIQVLPREENAGGGSPSVATGIFVTSYPSSVAAGQDFNIDWRIDSNAVTTTPHTAIHWSNQSNLGTFTENTSAADSGYQNSAKEYLNGAFLIPGYFGAKITAPSSTGTIYFRAHALIEGKNYWTSEMQVQVGPSQSAGSTSPPPEPQEFSLAASDNGVEPSGLTVKAGAQVTLNFAFEDSQIYYGGLDVKSSAFPTIQYRKGGSSTASATFTAPNSNFTIDAYWPASGVHKWTLNVNSSG